MVERDGDVSEPVSPSSSGRAAICFLTRPQPQIDAAVQGRDCVIEIRPEEVQKRASMVIETEVDRLISEGHLPTDLGHTVKQDLLNKTSETPDSAFQWVNTAIERLQGDEPSITAKLDAIRPGLNSVYTDILSGLSSKATMGEVAGFMFRFLAFSQEETTLNLVVDFIRRCRRDRDHVSNDTTRADITSVLQNARGLFVLQDGALSLAHESVRDFLNQLPEEKWPLFSCEDQARHHADLAFLCLRCLIESFEQKPSNSEVPILDSKSTSNSEFVWYAIRQWPYHVRQCDDVSDDLLSALETLVQSNTLLYKWWYTLHTGKSMEKIHSNTFDEPIFVFAKKQLTQVIKLVRVKQDLQPPERKRSLMEMFGKRRSILSVPLERTRFCFSLDVSERDVTGETLLHTAASTHNKDLVNYLLEQGAKGDVFNDAGHTPFSKAVFTDDVAIAETLMSNDQAMDAKLKSDNPIQTIHMACYHKMESVIHYLLRVGVDIDKLCLDSGLTPLMVAAQAGHAGVVKILLNSGANRRIATRGKNTALHMAAQDGHSDVCKLLLDGNASDLVNLRTGLGQTAILKAAFSGHAETVTYLHSKGADMAPTTLGWTPMHAAASNGHVAVIHALLQVGTDYQGKDLCYRQPLHLAAVRGHLEATRIFVERGVEVDEMCMDQRDTKNRNLTLTPLALAVVGGHSSVFHYLLEKKADLGKIKLLKNATLLHWGASSGNYEIVRALVQDFGMDPFAKDLGGLTPFHRCAQGGRIEIARFLWNSPSSAKDIDVRDASMCTPLLFATELGNAGLAKFYLDNGADAQAVDCLGRNAAYLTVDFSDGDTEERTKTLKILLQYGASVSLPERHGSTPLHAAATAGREKLAAILLEHGASTSVWNNLGRSPLHCAALSKSKEVFEVLLSGGGDLIRTDMLGYTPLDMLGDYDPILTIPQVQAQKGKYKPLGRGERTERVNKFIAKELARHIELHHGLDRSVEEMQWARNMVLLFFNIDREDDVRISLEHILEIGLGGEATSRAQCGKCRRNSPHGPFWLCRDCRPRDIFVCDNCHDKYKDDDCLEGCSKRHSMLEFGGKYFKELKYGTVRKDGLTIQQWRENLRKEFGVVVEHTNSAE